MKENSDIEIGKIYYTEQLGFKHRYIIVLRRDNTVYKKRQEPYYEYVDIVENDHTVRVTPSYLREFYKKLSD